MSKIKNVWNLDSVQARLKLIEFLERSQSGASWVFGLLFVFIFIDFFSNMYYLRATYLHRDELLAKATIEGALLVAIVILFLARRFLLKSKKSVSARSHKLRAASVSSKIDEYFRDYEGVLSGKGQVVERHKSLHWSDTKTDFTLYETWLEIGEGVSMSLSKVAVSYSGGTTTSTIDDGYDIETVYDLRGDGTGTSRSTATQRTHTKSSTWGSVLVSWRDGTAEIRVRDEDSARKLHVLITNSAKSATESKSRIRVVATELRSGNLENLQTRSGVSWTSIYKSIYSLDRGYLEKILGQKFEEFIGLRETHS